eukprot:TRINITY_DN12552_c0_g1_i1.p1 TRINITY_DN12552_c0_g1~~TRINITY_DN12552_c0_g1_i1.p1  ORF type:complete len:290 (-),score=83.56 TRINITY_DN12552_c0_g1_i1:223-1041(-)
MSDRAEVAEWASSVNWSEFVEDDEVYATLSKLRTQIEEEGDDEDDGDVRIKLVAVGDGAVGKTSLLIAFAKGAFPSTYVPTVFENYTAQLDSNGKKILLHLWDTAGQEDYDRLRPLSYPGADIVLLCFSLVTEASYTSVQDKWYPEVDHYSKNVPTILVGTKVDLRNEGIADPSTGELDPVDTDKGEALADEIGAEKFIEVSAKTGENLKDVFESAVSIVLAARKAQGGGSDAPKSTSAGTASADEDSDEGPELKVVQRQKKQKRGGGCVLL